MRTTVTSALFLGSLVALIPGSAAAQDAPAPPAASAAPAPAPAPSSSDSAPEATPAPADASKKPSGPSGYAYGDTSGTPKPSSHHARYRKSGPVVNMPGFEATDDGGSRLFVQLSQNVPVEERKGKSSITYVLKGASPRVSNNTNALVTVHFNTPVSRARLVPHGKDLHFVIDLRAAATPTWKMSDGADKTSTLTIDFPKGDFVGPPPADEPANEADEAATEKPPAPASRAPATAPTTPAAKAPAAAPRQRRH